MKRAALSLSLVAVLACACTPDPAPMGETGGTGSESSGGESGSTESSGSESGTETSGTDTGGLRLDCSTCCDAPLTHGPMVGAVEPELARRIGNAMYSGVLALALGVVLAWTLPLWGFATSAAGRLSM